MELLLRINIFRKKRIMKYLKVIGFLFISFFLISVSFLRLSKNEDPRISLGNHLTEIAEYTNNKYGFTCIGTSIAFPKKISKARAYHSLLINRLLGKNCKILHDITIQLLAAINSDVSLKPYMEKYPFDLENITITLYFQEKAGVRVFHPNLEVAKLSYGFYTFLSVDPEKKFHYKLEIDEKFDPLLIEQ